MEAVRVAPCTGCFSDQPVREAFGFFAGLFLINHADETGGQCIGAGAYVGPRPARPDPVAVA